MHKSAFVYYAQTIFSLELKTKVQCFVTSCLSMDDKLCGCFQACD